MNSLYTVARNIWAQLRKINRRTTQPFSLHNIRGELFYRMYISSKNKTQIIYIDIDSKSVYIHYNETYDCTIALADPDLFEVLNNTIIDILKALNIHANTRDSSTTD